MLNETPISKKKGEQKNMTLNEAYTKLKTFADDEKLSENARSICWIGADAIREKMVNYRNQIVKELEDKIHIGIDTAYEEVMRQYPAKDYRISISDEAKCNDYIDGIAEILANVMVDDIEGDE